MNPSVLIVGAGPVGLTLACELTRYRVPVRVVDRARQLTPSADRRGSAAAREIPPATSRRNG